MPLQITPRCEASFQFAIAKIRNRSSQCAKVKARRGEGCRDFRRKMVSRKKRKQLQVAASYWTSKLWVILPAFLLVTIWLRWTLHSSALRSKPATHGSKTQSRNNVESDDICDRSLYPQQRELRSDQLTILVNGFAEARLPLLQENLQFYTASTVVHSVLVLWGNTSTPQSLFTDIDFVSLGAPIYIIRQASSSLNDRFLPRAFIKTKAVMICDDDISIDLSSLEFALQVWYENKKRIVGFFPRAHSYQLDSHSWIYAKDPQKYSIMLTKLMILATEYLYLYTCEMPAGVRNYVDSGMNCEDIAMNFLVSNRSALGPLLVDGTPRDWGDMRNSNGGITSMGLSTRVDHRKDRGECIAEFHRVWNGMELRFSYAKAVPDVEEQVLCEKFGYLIQCDQYASSMRDARRIVGENLVTHTYKYAYVTLLQSNRMFFSALVLAQSLRSSGTVHDLVLLINAQSSLNVENSTLREHFDVVKSVNTTTNKRRWKGFGKLNAWQLVEYKKVIFLEVNSLVLVNLDHLFQLPEPAAAPQINAPDEFNPDLFVLEPSESTYSDILGGLEESVIPEPSSEYALLNKYFSGWFQMPARHRLPLYYNLPVHLSLGEDKPGNMTMEPPAVVRIPKVTLASVPEMMTRAEETDSASTHDIQMKDVNFGVRGAVSNPWCSLWLQLLEALRSNKFQPLEDETKSPLSKSGNAKNLTWPVGPRQALMQQPFLHPNDAQKAFVTVIWAAEQLTAVAGWAATYAQHHTHPSWHKTLLLVHSKLKREEWSQYRSLFSAVVVVDPVEVGDHVLDGSSLLLHVWNQTSYKMLIFVHPASVFVDNCNFLLEFDPFAAMPSYSVPDTFSTRVMVIQPDHITFLELCRKLASPGALRQQGMTKFLNKHYSGWFQSSHLHRIAPISNSLVDIEKGLDPGGRSWRIFSFYSSNLADVTSETAKIWRKLVCGVQQSSIPLSIIKLICNAKNMKTG